MNDNRSEISVRLQGARDAAGLSVAETAKALNLSEADYAAFESGKRDLPMGLLPEVANLFGVAASAILTGGDSHARLFSVTRKGTGAAVARRKCYHYESLASGFAGPDMQPFLVSVDPKPDKPFNLNSHAGQEFNLVVEGTLELMINGHTIVLEEGDSIYFDANCSHGMRAMNNKPVRFLAIITS